MEGLGRILRLELNYQCIHALLQIWEKALIDCEPALENSWYAGWPFTFEAELAHDATKWLRLKVNKNVWLCRRQLCSRGLPYGQVHGRKFLFESFEVSELKPRFKVSGKASRRKNDLHAHPVFIICGPERQELNLEGLRDEIHAL